MARPVMRAAVPGADRLGCGMPRVLTSSGAPEALPAAHGQILALVGAILAAYANSLNAPFLFDDTAAVLHNPTIRELGSWAVLQPPSDGSATTGRPLVNLTLALNHAWGGAEVFGYHAVNLAIHLLAALALFGLVRRTWAAARPKSGPAPESAALTVALIWALHPLQTETVVSVAQRTEALCGLWLLLTLYTFARGWRALAVLCCLAGMATKEVMVVAPVLVLAYDRAFMAGTLRRALRERRGFYAALASTWLLLGALLVHAGGSRGTAAGFGLGVSPWRYLLTQTEALGRYLRLAVWPEGLTLDYGTHLAQSVADVLVPSVLVLALLGVSAWAWLRRPAAGFVGAWFFLILAPSSSVVPLVTQTIAEHRMYLPLAAVVVLAVWGVHALVPRHLRWVCAAAVLALGAITIARNHDYHDAVTIWADTVAKQPGNARAQNNLGWAWHERGDFAEATRHYARAVALSPAYVSARYNWGALLLAQNDPAAAAEQLQVAVRLAPQHIDARVNLGNALLRVGRVDEAIVQFEAAARQQPGADVQYNLGLAYLARGDDDQAERHLAAALQREPTLAEAYYNLGRIAERRGRAAEAERQYNAALALEPAHSGAHGRLGLLCARTERLDAAAAHFRAVLRTQPDNADALANLGNVHLLLQQPAAALENYERALRLRPDDARTRENIDLAREALRAVSPAGR